MSLPKKILPLLIANLFIVYSIYGQKLGNDNNFHIEGRVKHFGNGFIVGSIINSKSNTVTLDTILIKNDTFNHNGQITDRQIVRYVVSGDRFSRYRKVVKDGDSVLVDFADKRLKAVEAVAYPGADIKIDGIASTYFDAYPSGGLENNLLASVNRKRYPLFSELSNLDYSDKKNIRKVLQNEEIIVDSIDDIEDQFIKNNPSSIISSYIVMERFQQLNKNNPGQADSLLSLLQPNEDNIYYQNIILLQRNRSKEKSLKIGDAFPNFETKFVYKGSNFNFGETKGKYRLIDFWGTWCIPCVREMPKLKKFYEKHKDNLVLIGIANDTYQRWEAFLDKNSYTWIQLIDQGPSKLSDKIKVEVYPTKYLVDPEGKIILIVKDADEDVWTKIESLINGKHKK